VIPLAYYFKETELTAEDLRTDDSELFDIKQDIKRWFITSLLHGTFSGRADTVLRRTREVIQEQEGDSFPIDEINQEMVSLGKMVGFNDEIAENVLEYEKGGNRTFLALTLLYDQDDFGSIQYHQDHIFPESRLTTENLIERGIEPDKAEKFAEWADKFANIQLLTRKENETKQDTSFDEWISGQNDLFYNRHLIPENPEYHKIESFDRFLEKRGEMIKSELISILGDPSEGEKELS
jgi:hypothetical protein